jgi:ATP-dependent metalloprotease
LVENDGRLPIVVFLIGLWVRAKKSMERAFSELFDWWPFWRQEKRLAKLITEADANREDAVKQSALFVELNKHRFVCVEFFNWKFQIVANFFFTI